MEYLIKKVVIEGVEFQIIKKSQTLYAGYKAYTDNSDGEAGVNTCELFANGYKNIKSSLTPSSMICLSIGYKEYNHGESVRRSLMHCQETSERNQPEGITVVESAPCYMIKVESTDATWALVKKITGEDNPHVHMAPLFGLCEKLFCNAEFGFELMPDFSDTYEIEYYNFDGSKYAGISVAMLSDADLNEAAI